MSVVGCFVFLFPSRVHPFWLGFLARCFSFLTPFFWLGGCFVFLVFLSGRAVFGLY